MEWTSSMLQEVITDLRARQGDSSDIEVKAAAQGVPALGETLCAFANMPEGGTLILGLDESNGFTPTGLGDVAGLEQGVAAQARTAVVPPVGCDFQTFQVGGEPVLVATVAGLPLLERPARYGGKAFLRQSDGDYVMSEQEIAQIELLKTQAFKPTNPDRQSIPGTTVKDLDADLLAAFIANARSSSRRYAAASEQQILSYTGVQARDGSLTLAGLYAMGVAPQAYSPSLGITAAVQLPRQVDGPRTKDLVHLTGPIPDLLDDAMGWVLRNTQSTMGYDERGHGMDRSEIPMRAVREIVANALVHRNLDPLTDSKRVEIRLLHDRLVISSPGGLWGVSESQLGRPGAKSAVNPVLYDICKNVRIGDGMRVIEGEGGGIREAVSVLREAGLRSPSFVDKGIQFTAFLFRHTLMGTDDLTWLHDIRADELSSEERAILVSMRYGETWHNARVRSTFAPMDSVNARRSLQRLVDAGYAEMKGVRGSARYAIRSEYAATSRRVVEVEEIPPVQPTLPVDEASASVGLSRHGEEVLTLLTEPMSVGELVKRTGLTPNQVRYALKRLIRVGEVRMRGAQGVRGTRYEAT